MYILQNIRACTHMYLCVQQTVVDEFTRVKYLSYALCETNIVY